jgi:hypothetical protein
LLLIPGKSSTAKRIYSAEETRPNRTLTLIRPAIFFFRMHPGTNIGGMRWGTSGEPTGSQFFDAKCFFLDLAFP